MIEVKDKKIAVIGLSRTGLASARMLVEWGAEVVVSDVKTCEQLKDEMEKLSDLNLDYELGGHGEKCLDADMIVVSPGVPLDIPFFYKAVENQIPIISEIELAYHFTEANIIAITGTNGKTTTTSIIGDILKNAGIGDVRVAGNIGNPLVAEAADLTGDDWLVVEISSFQLETIREFRPDISVYLNFTPDHLDRHKSIDNYWEAKKRIFENQTSNDIAIVNGDDHNVMRAVAGFPGKIYQVSLESNIIVSEQKVIEAKEINRGVIIKDDYLTIMEDDREIQVIQIADIPLKGKHNIQNVSFAILASYLAGSSVDVIRRAIVEFKSAAHRLEEVFELPGGIKVIDDSKATNPDAGIKALQAFDDPLVLIAGGQDRDADFSAWAVTIRDRVKTLVLIGETRYKMKEEALNHGFANINIHIVENMQNAVQIAAENLDPGDVLLLAPACPSWDMYPSYKVRGKEFQDNVRKILLK
ncbi:MAG: UDP-N-acetylmuramoyl-L-alanine--D-glutamate ligase [Halanaerobiales bacterium]